MSFPALRFPGGRPALWLGLALAAASPAGAVEWQGAAFGLHYTQEDFGVVHGGRRPGGEDNGLLELDLDLDLEKLAGWRGAAVHASGFAAAGESLSAERIGDESNVSNINMRNSVRLFELWLEQKFGGAFAIRFGLLATDSQFYDSAGDAFGARGGLLFLNSDFGALPLLSFNVSEPIFPIAAPGVCLTVTPADALTFRAAIYDGNPAPDVLGDPSPGFRPGTRENDHGLDFHLSPREGALLLAEVAFALNPPPPADGQAVAARRGRGGIYKLGGFYHTDEFTRWRNGRGVQGNAGGYFVANQMLWPENARGDQGLSAFARLGYAPPDRNALDFTADGGVNYRGLLPGRDGDLCGLGVSCKHYSRDYAATARREGSGGRDHETIFELTYRAVLAPWLAVQPDVQYVLHPAGDHDARDALVAGVRVAMDF
jgi:porin